MATVVPFSPEDSDQSPPQMSPKSSSPSSPVSPLSQYHDLKTHQDKLKDKMKQEENSIFPQSMLSKFSSVATASQTYGSMEMSKPYQKATASVMQTLISTHAIKVDSIKTFHDEEKQQLDNFLNKKDNIEQFKTVLQPQDTGKIKQSLQTLLSAIHELELSNYIREVTHHETQQNQNNKNQQEKNHLDGTHANKNSGNTLSDMKIYRKIRLEYFPAEVLLDYFILRKTRAELHLAQHQFTVNAHMAHILEIPNLRKLDAKYAKDRVRNALDNSLPKSLHQLESCLSLNLHKKMQETLNSQNQSIGAVKPSSSNVVSPPQETASSLRTQIERVQQKYTQVWYEHTENMSTDLNPAEEFTRMKSLYQYQYGLFKKPDIVQKKEPSCCVIS